MSKATNENRFVAFWPNREVVLTINLLQVLSTTLLFALKHKYFRDEVISFHPNNTCKLKLFWFHKSLT